MTVNVPTNLLRSFVAIVDTGSMLHAADRVYVTQSALSLQIKRLEELLDQSLFHREGRRLSLTPPGAVMLDYARKVLDLHDEAVAAVAAANDEPHVAPIRIGIAVDMAEALLTGLLTRFAKLHPHAALEARVAASRDLVDLLGRGQLDVVVVLADAGSPDAIATTPVAWFGRQDLCHLDTLPLAVLEAPCRFRDTALQALAEAGRPYRIVAQTPDIVSLRAAVEAGLGITCRTSLSMRGTPLVSPALPSLPPVSGVVHIAPELHAPAVLFAELAREMLADLAAPVTA